MIDHIKQLGDVSVAEKALILSSLTREPISLQDLENFLDEQQLAWRDEITSAWTGPLVAIMDGEGGALGEGLAELFRHMNKIRSVHVETDKPEWAVKCTQLLEGLQLAGVISEAQADAIVDLGGGKLHGLVTIDEINFAVQADIERQAGVERIAELDALKAEIANRFIHPAAGSQESIADLRARIKQEL